MKVYKPSLGPAAGRAFREQYRRTILIERLKRRRKRHLAAMAEVERVRAGLARIAAMPGDPPGSDEAFMRAIDEGRPERPLFEGRY